MNEPTIAYLTAAGLSEGYGLRGASMAIAGYMSAASVRLACSLNKIARNQVRVASLHPTKQTPCKTSCALHHE